MLQENVVKCHGDRNKLHNAIEPLESPVNDAIPWKIFFLISQQIFLDTNECIAEVQDDISVETVVVSKRLLIFELQLIA